MAAALDTNLLRCPYRRNCHDGDLDWFASSLQCQLTCQLVHSPDCKDDWDIPASVVSSGSDVYLLKSLLAIMEENGVRVSDYTSSSEKSLLQTAVVQEPVNFNIINELLNYMDASATKSDSCPLLSALKSNRTGDDQWKLINILLLAGADLTLRTKFGQNALTLYLKSLKKRFDEIHWSSIIDLLITKGCNVRCRLGDMYGTVLHQFLMQPGIPETNDNVSQDTMTEEHALLVIEKLIDCGVDLTVINDTGVSVLLAATQTFNVAVCKLLIDAVNQNQSRSLYDGLEFPNPIVRKSHLATKNHRSAVVSSILDILVNYGRMDINACNFDGSTALHKAAQMSALSINEALLKFGANPQMTDVFGNTVLHYAVLNFDLEPLECYLKEGIVDIDSRNNDELTPLHLACMYDCRDSVSVLIMFGSDIHKTASAGASALHFVLSHPESKEDRTTLPLLVELGVDINSVDDFGCSALHCAVFQKDYARSMVLLEAGINGEQRDYSGHTAADFSKMFLSKYPARDASGACLLEWPSMFSRSSLHLIELGSYKLKLGDVIKQIKALSASTATHSQSLMVGGCASPIENMLAHLAIGPVNQNFSENHLVKITVENFFSAVINTIGDMNSIFKSKLILSGSSYEGSKVGLPDEFDYMVELVNFSKTISSYRPTEKDAGFVSATVLPKYVGSLPLEYVTEDGTLKTRNIMVEFKKLFDMAVVEVHKKSWPHIIQERRLCSTLWREALLSYNLLWYSARYKFMHISVDVNPVVYVEQWPENGLNESYLVPNISLRGVYLIPKPLFRGMGEYEWSDKESLWRISLSHIELEIMQQMSDARDGFTLAKSLRMWPICPTVRDEPSHPYFRTFKAEKMLNTYLLKQLFFKTVDDSLLQNTESSFNAVGIARTIYMRLSECITRNQLTSYFIPGQNLLRNEINPEIALSFCRHILFILDGLEPEQH